MYLKKKKVLIDGTERILYITDHKDTAEQLRAAGEAVLIYLHADNRDQDFSGYLFAVEDPEDLEPEYVERVYRRLKGLPWNILETASCLVRETTPEDVDVFYRIYSNPAITRYMETLYPEVEQEKQYVREYIEKVYTFYGFGVWTVVERESGAVIGRAGISYREGFEEPELGFIIGVPWQGKGYAYEVCEAILGYASAALGFTRIQALVETENLPSLRLCRKLGFDYDSKIALREREYYRLIITELPPWRRELL
ncbi:Acetyltransferase (GNAT) family protein [Acetatifactor muris]|uniref:Acetyltransferase (GNAT) family protein n=2 Tax=Acetatifactor muris TaxID=879566 RepID=A0A2K4ZE28_9FIRM|nr:GNAT family N-acetyltransferase [Acetatifactor muris]SOY28727.1 Acetyltransferase (GNAT) family protein [Acetatifactor muris]